MNDPGDNKIALAAWLFEDAYRGDVPAVAARLDEGADINAVEFETGLSPLHIAVGRNHLALVQFLLGRNAEVKPDRQGRWPSTIAGLCEASGDICDLIADAEMKLGVV